MNPVVAVGEEVGTCKVVSCDDNELRLRGNFKLPLRMEGQASEAHASLQEALAQLEKTTGGRPAS